MDGFWSDPKKRGLVYQALLVLFVGLMAYFLFSNTQANLQRQNIASGLGFLSLEAGFEMGESVLSFDSTDTYGRALAVGALNTLKVALIGNFFAILLGILVGMGTLSSNWPISKIARGYVEITRNIPLLLQLFFWYSLFTEVFPAVRQALNPLPGVFISNRGVIFPIPENTTAFLWILVSLLFGVVGSFVLSHFLKLKQQKEGGEHHYWYFYLGLIVGLPLLTWLVFGTPTKMNMPSLQGFNFSGGYTFTPEFCSLLLGLVLYTGAFNAEIVRSGVLAIGNGQWEAAKALGLNKMQMMNLVILPQALRIIIPPITSQILNLTKNSSLAVAIGFPDYVSIANTTMNQTGQAIELVGSIMVVYLFFSLSSSFFMNWYNKKLALVEL